MSNMPLSVFKNEILGEEYRKYTHKSGLDIYIFPKKLSSAYAIFGTKYGSIHNSFRDENEQEWITVPDGIAHFLEHKLFACEDGSDAFEHFSKYGADANAYTSFTKTCYLFSCTDNFESSLAELLDFVTHPYFTEESIASEVGIIAEEIKMYDDSPSERCYYGMLEGMYESHSIRRNICGSEESISMITPEMLYSIHKRFYSPENMILVICGDVDDGCCLKIADRCLSDFTASPVRTVMENENCKESKKAYKPYVEQHMQVSKPLFRMGFKDTDIPKDSSERQKKDITMTLLFDMLFSESCEFYLSLLESGLISPSLSHGYTISESFAYGFLSGESEEPRAVVKKVLDHIDAVRKQGLCESDFIRCKRVLYADAVRMFDSTEGIANELFAFACDGTELLSYTDVIDGITLEDIKNSFEKAFSTESMTLSVILPLKK